MRPSVVLDIKNIQKTPATAPSFTAAMAVFLVLSGCGGGGDNPTPTIATAPTSAITVATTLNLSSLDNYALPVLPVHYDSTVATADNTPVGDPINDKVATLGRVLFYDKKLSINDTVACASCHIQSNGFSDPARFSTGFSGSSFTTAHSMRLGNIRYYRPGSAFWDKRAASVEDQASQPIQNSVEMGFDATHGSMAAVLTKLQAVPYYTELFTFAFGDSAITESRLQRALAQFERSMVSSGSRWDTAYAQNYNSQLPDKGLSLPAAGFSASEERGRLLFITAPANGGLGCGGCHQPPTFSLAANSLSNGLDAGETTIFKSPSLKNIALSRAFMHDGRFSTLAQVIEHYNSGMQAGPALDARLQTPQGTPRRMNMTSQEKADLEAFLQTLTDTAFVNDAKFSTPFKP